MNYKLEWKKGKDSRQSARNSAYLDIWTNLAMSRVIAAGKRVVSKDMRAKGGR
jgi:hypothetical protein